MSEPSKDYVDRELCQHQMCEQQRSWNQRFEDAGTAVQLARESIEHRLNGMNELREQINSERGTYVDRELFDKLVGSLEERVRLNESWKSEMVGRMWLVGGVLFVIQVAMAVYAFVNIHK